MTRYDYVCTGPSRDHMPPDAARAAGVERTRCIACHKAIKYVRRWGSWGAYDRVAFIRRLRELI